MSDDAAASERSLRRYRTLKWMRRQTGDLSFSAGDVLTFLRRFDAEDGRPGSSETRKAHALAVLDELQHERAKLNEAKAALAASRPEPDPEEFEPLWRYAGPGIRVFSGGLPGHGRRS
jgi:hypothetical protein